MFKYANQQKVYEVGRAKVGGQPGEYPTVLAGSIFYGKHKIVTDTKTGAFDKEVAEKLVRQQEEMSDITGNPIWLQIVADYGEAMGKYITWYADIGKDAFLIDSTVADARVAGAKKADEIGLSDRVIYNSINAAAQAAEIEALQPLKFTSAIVLGFNAMDMSVKGRMEMFTKGGAGQPKGMLTLATEKGITRPLLDVAATPLGSGSGATYRSIFAVKSQLGEPVGGGYHNIPSAWAWLKKFKKQPGKEGAYMPSDIGSNLVAITLGCDFCLYGPIEHSVEVFPAVAMNDIIVAEAAKDLGTVTVDEHPLKKLV
ncbi:tetrahydromethanopterin S-methyltransferase subunit H [Methanocella arvoryzae]|uniref:N(5)-methyltetrahydromethanopterin-coenzyme M methyltransferase, subunit H n=1 Tax=Methanocella arvoryzae (strain DSM 22066 / NBRC 105507 / MRE50) TaxID=351160 RepID=Q0W331_METAR|nr:tetrahydromethanopterin S-methyltransferase subunit H [Methanocella arvoryzae]CAJ37212.1 N(5)-methyltetrahydromethanopterin-coenzyme M methyltransferase, subunit H [Methanocella arvoryzae MRE50]